jgi:hypothetical protein
VDLLNSAPVIQLEGATLGLDTTAAINDPNASGAGNNVAVCTFATAPTQMAMRTRSDVSTFLTARTGTWDIYLRCAATAAAHFTLQLRWALQGDSVTTVPITATHDTTLATSFDYAKVYVGTISVPDDVNLSGIRLEVWASRDSGTGSLYMDFLDPVPADLLGGTFTAPSNPMDFWLGGQLVTPTSPGGLTAGTIDADGISLKLSAQNQAGGVPPAAGSDYSNAAVVTFLADLGYQQNGSSGAKIGELRIRDVTAGTYPFPAIDLKPVAGQQYSNKIVPISFAPVAAHLYECQVVYTVVNPGGWGIWVHNIARSEQLAIQSGQVIADASIRPRRVYAADATGRHRFELTVDGSVPVMLEPGLTLFYLQEGDLRLAGYSEPRNILGHFVTAGVVFAPGYNQ